MQTRSQTKNQIYQVDIDFDEASNAWNSNKKKLPNGCYSYVCGHELKNGEYCKKQPLRGSMFCYFHK